jgi:hypothetical protein
VDGALFVDVQVAQVLSGIPRGLERVFSAWCDGADDRGVRIREK